MPASDGLIQLPSDSTGKKVRTRTGMNRAADTTTHQEIHTVAGPDGDLAGVTAYGFAQATGEPSVLFYDPFDGAVIDTAHRWNTPVVAGTGAAVTQPSGTLTLVAGTEIGSYAYIISRPSFNALIPAFLQASFAIQVESGTSAAISANGHRFWGVGTASTAPTTSAPLINAVGFEVSTDGKLYAVVWSNSVRTTAIDLSSTGTGISTGTQPFDGAVHRYLIQYRTDRIYWFINGVLVASGSFVAPEVQTLPVRHSVVQNGTNTLTYKVLGSVVADTAGNSMALTDGSYQWRKAGVTLPSSFDLVPTEGWGLGGALNVNPNAIQKKSQVVSRVTADAGAPAAVTIVANTRKALIQIHHTAASITTKRIRRITVGALFGAAVQYGYEVYRVTAAPTGGAGLTPVLNETGEAASGASALVATYLPAAGTSGAISGIALAGATVLGATTGHGLVTVYDWKATGDQKPLVIRKGVLEGFALFVRGTGTVGPDPQIFIDFTEE